MAHPSAGLTERTDVLAEELRRITDDQAAAHPGPGAWSAKEILGHLVDSAVNNLPRFVEGRTGTGLVFPGYDQDAWVAAQQWQDHDWQDLVTLWRLLNERIVAVMQSTPGEDLERPRHPHSLHRIAWCTVPEDQPTTLGYLMQDYTGHLEHHLEVLFRQVETARRVRSAK